MANIASASPDKVITIKKFYGLNENEGGDTKLRVGEASMCTNWQVTRDGNLRRRPGKAFFALLDDGETVDGIWSGWVGGTEYLLAACNGYIYNLNANPIAAINSTAITTSNGVHFFGFDSKVYILNGAEYYSWDGLTFGIVTGYIPLVVNAIGPDGTPEAAGTLLEQVNKLNGYRRVQISPDNSGTDFHIPEKPTAIDYVALTRNGTQLDPSTDYEYTSGTGILKLKNNKEKVTGANYYEVGYHVTNYLRSDVTSMKYSELYSGTTDKRIFLYGDGSNETLYSDIDYNGNPTAEYFPDMNEIAVGDANTKITGLIRHHASLICFKEDSTWNITSSSMMLEDGSTIAAFHVIPVNRTLGNEAMGQVQLVVNNPRTLFHTELYEWRSNNAYSGNLSYDERQAKQISDRIYNTLGTFNLESSICFDDNSSQEYYIVYNGTALVHNYAVDAWYKYDNINATCFAVYGDELYFGSNDGYVYRLTDNALYDYDPDEVDNIKAINARWESGAMDFGADYMRKYSSVLWASIKPESHSHVEITIMTDRRMGYQNRIIAQGISTFDNIDFNAFSFAFNVQPQISKLKIKAKKFTYYRLIFINDKAKTVATVLGADIRMRQTGYAK